MSENQPLDSELIGYDLVAAKNNRIFRFSIGLAGAIGWVFILLHLPFGGLLVLLSCLLLVFASVYRLLKWKPKIQKR